MSFDRSSFPAAPFAAPGSLGPRPVQFHRETRVVHPRSTAAACLGAPIDPSSEREKRRGRKTHATGHQRSSRHGRNEETSTWRARGMPSRHVARRHLLLAGGGGGGAASSSILAAGAAPGEAPVAAVGSAEDDDEPIPTLRVLFAAGGTGGHVYPAIAIADALVGAAEGGRLPGGARRVEVHFAGTAHRHEATAVPNAGYPLHTVPSVALRRPLRSAANLSVPFKLAWAVLRTLVLIVRVNPHVVVGTGGYVSLPTCLAAVLARRPLVIQEQNAAPGMANKILARFAALACVAFEAATRRLRGARRFATHGNPTRAALREMSRDRARRELAAMFRERRADGNERNQGKRDEPGGESGPGPRTIEAGDRVLVVLGGSLGAAAINAALRRALPALMEDERLWVVWQAGASGFDALRDEVRAHPRLLLTPFVDRMEVVYAEPSERRAIGAAGTLVDAAADLAVARAGAITCSELLATRVPSVLVPSPNVAEDHQTVNAEEMAREGAAVVVREADLVGAGGADRDDDARGVRLEDVVGGLMRDRERLAAMAAAAAACDTPRAAENIADDIARLARIS